MTGSLESPVYSCMGAEPKLLLLRLWVTHRPSAEDAAAPETRTRIPDKAQIPLTSSSPRSRDYRPKAGWGGKNISKYAILKNPEKPEACSPPPRLRNPLNLKNLSHHFSVWGSTGRGVCFYQEDASYLPAWLILKNIFGKHKF